MSKLAVVFAILFFAAETFAYEPALCGKLESVYFSCSTKGKVISVCLTNEFGPDTGELTYRYGVVGDVELEYSASHGDLNSKYGYAFSSYAKGNISELSFSIGKYVYTIHSDNHVFRASTAGVFVEKDSKVVAYKQCDNPRPKNQNSLADLRKVGIVIGTPRGIGTEGD
ncbi:hypothetical protein L1D32_08625 [Shewanella insulae]|uniref:hypothetical protein n=1 Tax=Shewanella TaxID=22 RepID=UPI001EFE5F9D|nr:MULTISPECIES: hypothetical protein [Shewanella]MCG9738220.1 hypothetical protein [Shewanella insulae]MCL2908913.1 hypothetical protein [Shewanella aquimarina]